MYEGRTVAVVVPAYNEEALVGSTVSGIPAFVDSIIVVDDCSKDETAVRAQNADKRVEVEGAAEFGRRVRSSRYFELRYEDLVLEPELELGRVCDFLQLDFEPAMLAYHEEADDGALEDHPLLAKPPIPGARRWKEELDPKTTELFEAIAGGALTRLGYERAYPGPSARARGRAAVTKVLFRNRLAWWKAGLALGRRTPAWRLRQAYIRRMAGA